MTQTVLDFTENRQHNAVAAPRPTHSTLCVAPDHAPLSQFRSSTPRIWLGAELQAVKDIGASIQAEGLLFPLLVSPHNGRLFVIDGRKRLAALRRLRFLGQLPRSLNTVPYIMTAKSDKTSVSTVSVSTVMPRRELYARIKRKSDAGVTVADIAQALHLSRSTVIDVLNIARLSPALREAYWRGDLSLAQVKAFTTLPHHDAQNRLLSLLGPFAAVDTILNAVAAGQAVITIGDELIDDNIVIMPSTYPPQTRKKAA